MRGRVLSALPQQKSRARRLRREQTPAERKLWFELRDRRFAGTKFRRQHPIGSFIADFCAPEQRLIIEVDGGQHADRREADASRSAFLEAQGYRIIRFWANDVFANIEGVVHRIAEALDWPLTLPSPQRGEGEGRE